MAKVREDDSQGGTGEARIKAPWLVAAEACKAGKRPLKLQVYVDADARRRLEMAALVEGLDFSMIVSGLIKSNLIGYYAGLRGGSKDEAA